VILLPFHGGGVAQVVERLPRKCEILNSNPIREIPLLLQHLTKHFYLAGLQLNSGFWSWVNPCCSLGLEFYINEENTVVYMFDLPRCQAMLSHVTDMEAQKGSRSSKSTHQEPQGSNLNVEVLIHG
jgi:hypothetical protein